jgi:thioredoxin 1
MPVKHVTTMAELKQIAASSRLTVVDAFATWCGPCKAIAPVVEELSRKFTTTNFVKVDVDEAQECAQALQVTAMPTFVFFKNGLEIERMKGADPAALERFVQQHASSPFEGAGHRLGDAASPASSPAAGAADAAAIAKQHAPLLPQRAESRAWPMEVPAGQTPGRALLQLPDGTRNPLVIAPAVHTVSDFYRAVGIMLETTGFALSVREGSKVLELERNSAATLKDAKVSGATVLLKFI